MKGAGTRLSHPIRVSRAPQESLPSQKVALGLVQLGRRPKAWRTFLEVGRQALRRNSTQGRQGRGDEGTTELGRPCQAALQAHSFLNLLGSGVEGPPQRGKGSWPAGGRSSKCDTGAKTFGRLWFPTSCRSLMKLPARRINKDVWAWPAGTSCRN